MLRALFPGLCMLGFFFYLLTGCSSTKIVQGKPGVSLEAQLSQLDNELMDRCNRDDLKPLFFKTACRADDIAPEQLTDKSTISENEKTILLKSRLERIALLEKRHELIQNFGDSKDKEIDLLLYQAESQTDKYVLDLFESKITWGEYNKFRKDIFETYKKQMSRLSATR